MRTWFKTVWTGNNGHATRVEFWTRIRAFEGQGPRDHWVAVENGKVLVRDGDDWTARHAIAPTTETRILREARRMARTAL